MRICVIDGQGGGIGGVIIRRLKEEYGRAARCWPWAPTPSPPPDDEGRRQPRATGQNAIVVSVRQADVVIGPIGIVLADSMMGEVTSQMAAAVASCRARKFLCL